MNPAENILDDDGHHHTHRDHTSQPQCVLDPVVCIESGSIPKGNRAGNGEAKGHRRSVIVSDAYEKKGHEEAEANTQEVGQRFRDEHCGADQGVGCRQQESRNCPEPGNQGRRGVFPA